MTPGTKRVVKLFALMGAIFSTLLVALAFKFYYAFSTHQSPMTSSSYEVGKDFQKHLDETRDSDDRSLQVDFPADLQRRPFRLSLVYSNTERKPIAGAVVKLDASRRATNEGALQKECTTDSAGRCVIELAPAFPGRWEIQLFAKDAAGKRTVRGEVTFK